MGAVTAALARSAERAGAVIRVDAEAARIKTRAGRAVGVELADGGMIECDAVFSNADPKRTFLGLIDPGVLPQEFIRDVENIRIDGSVIKINCALSELPDYSALPGVGPGPQHTGRSIFARVFAIWTRPFGTPRLESRRRVRSWRSTSSRRRTTVWLPQECTRCRYSLSTLHTISLPEIGNRREEVADNVIDTLAEYAPNVKRAIVDRQVLSPVDLERRFGLTGGNIFHGEILPGQLLSDRPLPGWSDYTTPVEGLYLCGSGAHPGGGVTGAPGYNAAARYLAGG